MSGGCAHRWFTVEVDESTATGSVNPAPTGSGTTTRSEENHYP